MSQNIESLMREAIEEGKKSQPEDHRAHPKVGAIVFKDGDIKERAHRGELAKGDHAEFSVLERKLLRDDLFGCSLITTLEPCTSRNHPKSPCAWRIITRRINKVYVGILKQIRGQAFYS